MARRLLGLVLIVSVLMPIALGVAGALAVRQFVLDVEDAARAPLTRIRDRLEDVRQTLDDVTAAFQDVSDLVVGITEKIGKAFSGITRAINDLRISIPAISIPDIVFRFPDPIGRQVIPVPDIPGFNLTSLPGVKSVLSSITGVLGDLNAALGRLTVLGTLPQEINQIAAEVRALADGVLEASSRWLGRIGWIAIVFGIWLAAVYVALAYRWLSAGWRMLRGLPTD